jgi:uncharacterized protein YdeI (YjbR/CyaY-like superfamily)
MKIVHFKSATGFRAWLDANHGRVAELWVGFYKKDSGRVGITYSEAVDEALCFGWIDGIKKRVDDLSYTHRFTPRKSKSNWSLVNIRKARELIRLGRMKKAGLEAFERRDPRRSGVYSFENQPRALDPAYVKQFQANAKAWQFFQAQPPGRQRLACWWVQSAKKEETRQKRLAHLIAESAKGRRVGVLSP